MAVPGCYHFGFSGQGWVDDCHGMLRAMIHVRFAFLLRASVAATSRGAEDVAFF